MRLGNIVVVCSFLLVGCTATPYQPRALTGGFSEEHLEGNIWRISFSGNGYTTAETVQTYWLYRCAEFTLQEGYEGFEILSHLQLTRRDSLRPLGSGYHVVRAQVYYPIYMDSMKPTIEADIRLLRNPFDPAPPRTFDAAELKEELEPIVDSEEKCGGKNVCPHVHKYLHPAGTFDEDPI